MAKNKFPITQQTISNQIKRPVKSPILVNNLGHYHIRTNLFLKTFTPLFTELPWDKYEPRLQRVNFLKEKFPAEAKDIQSLFSDYYLGKSDLTVFEKWRSQLEGEDLTRFEKIQPTCRRSVAQFKLGERGGKFFLARHEVGELLQDADAENLDKEDYRTLPRTFAEAPEHHVENHLFATLLMLFYKKVLELQPDSRVTITAHFMSKKALAKSDAPSNSIYEEVPKINADYIVPALVFNRENVADGESQVLEKLEDGTSEIIFRRILKQGEFIFQANGKGNGVYENELGYEVTPFHLADASKGEGCRDIIRFDIVVDEKE